MKTKNKVIISLVILVLLSGGLVFFSGRLVFLNKDKKPEVKTSKKENIKEKTTFELLTAKLEEINSKNIIPQKEATAHFIDSDGYYILTKVKDKIIIAKATNTDIYLGKTYQVDTGVDIYDVRYVENTLFLEELEAVKKVFKNRGFKLTDVFEEKGGDWYSGIPGNYYVYDKDDEECKLSVDREIHKCKELENSEFCESIESENIFEMHVECFKKEADDSEIQHKLIDADLGAVLLGYSYFKDRKYVYAYLGTYTAVLKDRGDRFEIIFAGNDNPACKDLVKFKKDLINDNFNVNCYDDKMYGFLDWLKK